MSLTDEFKLFLNTQLDLWPAANDRYNALNLVRQREIVVGGFPVRLQFNPARAVSATAKLDSESIAKRLCFLCEINRPSEQRVRTDFSGLQTLVNPFPIFPYHFTLASILHQHQDNVDFKQMGEIARQLPGMVVFYNGSGAGASAPDHLHYQVGNSEFLPLCGILDVTSGDLLKIGEGFTAYYPDNLPVEAVHFISDKVTDEMLWWIETLLPESDLTGRPDRSKRNLLMWVDSANKLHTLFIPRAAHRPACFFKTEVEGGMLVSPGAVDMAGVIILPRESDFEKMTRSDLRSIYDEVSFPLKEADAFKRLMLR